jgi:Protein of unknown function DUF72
VEVESTYYRPLTEHQANIWAERSPQGFRFNAKACSLLTGHPTQPRPLSPDLRELLDGEAREKRSIYASHCLTIRCRRHGGASTLAGAPSGAPGLLLSRTRSLAPALLVVVRSERLGVACGHARFREECGVEPHAGLPVAPGGYTSLCADAFAPCASPQEEEEGL